MDVKSRVNLFALESLGDISGIDCQPPAEGVHKRKRRVRKKIAASVVSEFKAKSIQWRHGTFSED